MLRKDVKIILYDKLIINDKTKYNKRNDEVVGAKMKNVLDEITRLRLKRGWSEYELAKYSGLSQSTISTWYRKGQTPTIQTLEKVCSGLGVTLSQFFAEGDDVVALTEEQRMILDHWAALNQNQKKAVMDLLENMQK